MIGLAVGATITGPFCGRCGETIPVRQGACDCPEPCGAIHLEAASRESTAPHKTCEPSDA